MNMLHTLILRLRLRRAQQHRDYFRALRRDAERRIAQADDDAMRASCALAQLQHRANLARIGS
jgi:hypothetical protein